VSTAGLVPLARGDLLPRQIDPGEYRSGGADAKSSS